MIANPPPLSDEEIRTLFMVVPEILIRVLCPLDFVEYVTRERKIAESNGQRLDVIGWPNGVTILWTRPNPEKPIDVEELVAFYHSNLRLQEFNGGRGKRYGR